MPSVPGTLLALLGPGIGELPLPALIEQVAALLASQDGIQVDRMSWSVPVLHPSVRAHQLIWRRDQAVEEVERSWDTSRAAFADSPIGHLYQGKATSLRQRLDPGEPRTFAYPFYDELAAMGFTDYFIALEAAADPFERGPISWATRRPGGFTDEHVGLLRALLPLLALLLRLEAHRRRGRGLLEIYLGRDAASQVLDGRIRRGDLVEMDAAICFCDIRNFTAMSAHTTNQKLLHVLDDVFDAVVGAAEAESGLVLKFIGDAVLVVFREGSEGGGAAARALRAARDGLARLEDRNRVRVAAGEPELHIGFGLHFGRVSYGNVGGPARLDFTVIGNDVNLASRIEGLCRALAARIVTTEALYERLPEADRHSLRGAGPQVLKGVEAPASVWICDRSCG